MITSAMIMNSYYLYSAGPVLKQDVQQLGYM